MRASGREKFISNALKLYCQKRSIKIGNATPYIHEENRMSKRYWRILAIMKDILLINNGLLVNFWIKAMDISNYLQSRLSTKYFKHIVIPEKT